MYTEQCGNVGGHRPKSSESPSSSSSTLTILISHYHHHHQHRQTYQLLTLFYRLGWEVFQKCNLVNFWHLSVCLWCISNHSIAEFVSYQKMSLASHQHLSLVLQNLDRSLLYRFHLSSRCILFQFPTSNVFNLSPPRPLLLLHLLCTTFC